MSEPPPAAPPDVEVGGVRFAGAFRPPEREFLAAQFGPCRFRLLGRSEQGAGLALVEWEGKSGAGTGPRPLVAAPRTATYVLSAGASGLRLDRVDSQADLTARFPGHFDAARVRQDWRQRLRRWLKDVWPALMMAVATAWVLALVWACRPFG